MAHEDGSIYISTKFDASEMEKGGAKIAEKVGSIASTAAKGFAVASAAAITAVSAMTKGAVAAYAEYEQLQGGVETLFKDAAGTVSKYAAQAYKTAGVSANSYMEQVTTFSASLLKSLGGDTEPRQNLETLQFSTCRTMRTKWARICP